MTTETTAAALVSPAAPAWTVQHNAKPEHCWICETKCTEGYTADPGQWQVGAFVCGPCARALTLAYVAAMPGLRLIGVQEFALPLATLVPDGVGVDDVTISLTFAPTVVSDQVDVQIAPEPATGIDAMRVLNEAARRLDEYIGDYVDELVDEQPPIDRGGEV